jgi:hypothetical protein
MQRAPFADKGNKIVGDRFGSRQAEALKPAGQDERSPIPIKPSELRTRDISGPYDAGCSIRQGGDRFKARWPAPEG